MVVALSLMLLFSHALLIAKTCSVLHNMLKQSAMTAVNPLVRQIQEAYALGIYPGGFLQLGQLNQLKQSNTRLTHLEWLDVDGKLLAQSGEAAPVAHTEVLQAIPKAIKLRKPVELEGEPNAVLVPVLNTFDQAVGVLQISYQTQELEALKMQLVEQSVMIWIAMSLAGGILLLGLPAIERRGKRIPLPAYLRLTLLATVGMLITAASLFEKIDQAAEPVLMERVRSLAAAEQTVWDEALRQGFGHAEFKDLPQRISNLAAQHPELKEVKLLETSQNFSNLGSSLELVKLDGDARLLLLPNPDFLQSLKLNLLLDYVTLAVVMFFFFAQFKSAQGKDLASALGENQTDKLTEHLAEQVRPALFLYFLSEEFLRPFLPNYAAVLEPAYLTQLNGNWAGSLSISLFMLVVALSQPVLNRIGTQRQAFVLMKWGCALTALAQGMTGLSINTETLLLGRALAGLGYSCAFVAAQSVLLMRYGPEKRTLAFASLVAAIMAATVVGPAFGGLLADNFGPGSAVTMAALTPVLAALLFVRQRPENTYTPNTLKPAKPSPLTPVLKVKSAWLPGLTNSKLLCLSLFAAVPAKMMLTGLLFYLLPKTLTQLSESSASLSGRLILLYGLLMLIAAPWLAKRWQTQFQNQSNPGQLASKSVCWGLLISALLGLAPLVLLAAGGGVEHKANPQVWMGLAMGVALALGLGQASSISSQGALVQIYQSRFAAQLPPFAWLGTYRLIERIGNALGPLLVAWMMGWMSAESILAIFGIGSACCAAMVYLTLDARQITWTNKP